MRFLFESYIFLRESWRGKVGLNENIDGIFLQPKPDTLTILIALFNELDAEEYMVSNLLNF